MVLKGKKILVGVTGSIAAYKIPFLVRLLKKEGALVKVIMTPSAKEFITPLTLATLSENPVNSEFFDSNDGTWNSHVDYGNWADLYLIAPVTSNTLAKLSSGLADNVVVASYMAAKCPVFIAPAMDVDMYKHKSTQKNIDSLKSFGNTIIDSKSGELASGLCGEGRMEEPEEICRQIKEFFGEGLPFKGKKVLVTAGPTYESIDPVRFIGNHSSGKMGFAIAECFAKYGADVKLVAGPTEIKSQTNSIERFDVISAEEMYLATTSLFPKSDIAVMCAAVADYTPKEKYNSKLKKQGNDLSINLIPTKDILKSLGEIKTEKQTLIGFALETENEIENSKKKLESKNLDYIVLNSLNDNNSGFGYDTNKITIIDKKFNIETFDLKSKSEAAEDIVNKLIVDKNNKDA